MREAGLEVQDKVLEIGCGMGTILTCSQQRVKTSESYVGIDLSYEMIVRAREKLIKLSKPKPVEFLVGDAVRLPFRTNLFDVVLLSHIIKYLTDDQFRSVLHEIARVLKPKGRIIVWEFAPFLTGRITQFISSRCQAQEIRQGPDLKAFLEKEGYETLRPFQINTPWLPWRNVAFCGRTQKR